MLRGALVELSIEQAAALLENTEVLDALRALGHDPLAVMNRLRSTVVARARTDGAAFNAHVLRTEDTNRPIVMSPMHVEWHDIIDHHKRVALTAYVESGKALNADTCIPTPAGWKRMGDLRVGDTVFAGDGTPTRVTLVSQPTTPSAFYAVNFSPVGANSMLYADADHLWEVRCINGKGKLLRGYEVQSTRELVRSMFYGRRYAVRAADPVEYAEVALSSPYDLGKKLACKEGWGAGNPRRIPEVYRRASIKQRKELLRGLEDACGARRGAGRAFAYSLEGPGSAMLATDIAEVLSSMGEVPTVEWQHPQRDIPKYALPPYAAEVIRCGQDARFARPDDVVGNPLVDVVAPVGVSYLPRFGCSPVTEQMALTTPKGSKWERTITRIDKVSYKLPDPQFFCIRVEHPSHTYLAGHDYTVTHNTQQLSVGRSLFELGKNPNLRVVVVSKTVSQASKITTAVQKYIAGSSELHEVFPALLPGVPWQGGAFNVVRSAKSKDHSFEAIGVFGSILGARIDLLILDDVLDFENTRTEYQREKLKDWVFKTLLGRLTAEARVIVVGNPWHPDDLLHVLATRPDWRSLRYPVQDHTGTPVWPSQWPRNRIDAKAIELGPLEFARQMMCETRSDDSARFRREWIDRCIDNARRADPPVAGFVDAFIPGNGWFTVTGVDLGVSLRKGSGFTVFFTIAVGPDDQRRVLDIEFGKWQAPEIVRKIHDKHHRYNSVVFVEDNGAQAFIAQFATAHAAIPLRQFRTGRNKLDPALGVESIAAELANGKWIIPYAGGVGGGLHPAVEAWIKDMLYYAPEAHTGDLLMACWIAREGARAGEQKAKRFFLDTMRR